MKMGTCVNTLDNDYPLPLELISGTNGLIRCLPDVEEPGIYTVKFTVLDEGHSITSSDYFNFFQSDTLMASSFEIYPEVTSVEPKLGSVLGGTRITIRGSGFTSSLPTAEQTEVSVGNDAVF
mgnify:CR=1 FL=1